MDFLLILSILCLIILLFDLIFVIFADADIITLYYERFGKKPETLRNKIVWITGASSGIGEFLAYELSKINCKLILSARRIDKLDEIAKKCKTLGASEAVVIELDVLNVKSHEGKFAIILEKFGHLDILINNAGRSQQGDVLETPLEIEKSLFEINYFAAISIAKIVLKHMIKRQSGQIAFTSSIAGLLGSPRQSTYSATKHAIHGWVKGARVELGSKVDIQLLCPGPVVSEIRAHSFTDTVDEEFKEDVPNSQKKMSTERCAKLIIVALANRVKESWISNQPILLLTYLGQYFPLFYHWFVSIISSGLVSRLRYGKKMGKKD